jgi:hypothetical protein
MDPIDFLITAENLKDSTNESDIRTSIGRSYYSVFLYLREQLKSLGVEKKVKPKNEAHEFVSYSLQFCDIPEGMKIGSKLNNLRQYRRDADYELSKVVPNTKSNDVFSLSKLLIQEFRDLNTESKQKIAVGAKKAASLKNWTS